MAQQSRPSRKKKRPIGFNVSGSTDDHLIERPKTAPSPHEATERSSPTPEFDDEKALKDLRERLKKMEQQSGIKIESIDLKAMFPNDPASQAAAAELNRRLFSKILTPEEKEEATFSRHNPANHPRYKEWQRWCEQQIQWAHEAKLDKGVLRLPSFRMWLLMEEKPQNPAERSRPRIQSDNPPQGNVYHANKFFNQTFHPTYARELLTPWKLFTYLKTFSTILSTGARVEITLWFSIPDSQRDVSDELHSVTHRELRLLMKGKQGPP